MSMATTDSKNSSRSSVKGLGRTVLERKSIGNGLFALPSNARRAQLWHMSLPLPALHRLTCLLRTCRRADFGVNHSSRTRSVIGRNGSAVDICLMLPGYRVIKVHIAQALMIYRLDIQLAPSAYTARMAEGLGSRFGSRVSVQVGRSPSAVNTGLADPIR